MIKYKPFLVEIGFIEEFIGFLKIVVPVLRSKIYKYKSVATIICSPFINIGFEVINDVET